MPVKSKAQSRFLNWKFGHKWVKKHHFAGKTGDLPEKKPEDKKDKKDKRKEEMTTSVNVGGGPPSKSKGPPPPFNKKKDDWQTTKGGKGLPRPGSYLSSTTKKEPRIGSPEWIAKQKSRGAPAFKKKDEAALRRVMHMVYQEEARLRKSNVK